MTINKIHIYLPFTIFTSLNFCKKEKVNMVNERLMLLTGCLSDILRAFLAFCHLPYQMTYYSESQRFIQIHLPHLPFSTFLNTYSHRKIFSHGFNCK